MKKPIVMALTIASAVTFLGACDSNNTQANVAKNLDYNLNVLSTTVSKLDTIDNDYIKNPDIYSTGDNSTDSSNISNIDTMSTSPKTDYKVQYLAGAILPRPVSNDEVRRQNFIPKYDTDNGIRTLEETHNNEVETSNKSIVPHRLGDTHNMEYLDEEARDTSNTLTNLLTKEIIEQYCSDCGIEVNDTICKNCGTAITSPNCTSCGNDNHTLYNLLYNAIKANSQQNTSSNTEAKATTTKARQINYKPRYVSSNTTSSIDTGTNLDAYLNKVEELYTMTNDVIAANDTFGDKKDTLLSQINEVKELTECLKNGECKPSDQQLQAISNYVYDLRTANNRLKSNVGSLTNEISNINKNSNFGISKSIDLINSNYMRILNHLDVRITYLNNALSTLDQVRYLLLETMINETIDGNQMTIDIVINDNIDTDISDDNIDSGITDTDSNDNIDSDIIDTESNETYPDTDVSTDDTEDIAQEENDTNSLDEPTVSDEATNDDEEQNNTDITENEDNNEVDNTVNTQIDQETAQDDTTLSEEEPTIENIDEPIVDNSNPDMKTNTNSLLDTYNENLYNNLDLDSRRQNNVNNTDETDIQDQDTVEDENTETQDNTIQNTDTMDNNVEDNAQGQLNNEANTNNVGATGGSTGVGVGVGNGIGGGYGFGNQIAGQENSLGYGIGQNHNDINVPNGTFQNGIIYQNNLNNGVNNGANGMGTGYNGTSGLYDENNKNINTYGFNTMVDMLNRGTVNNGINTLELNEKPVMVNN